MVTFLLRRAGGLAVVMALVALIVFVIVRVVPGDPAAVMLGTVVLFWLFAWIIANLIPLFSPLISLIGAVAGTWICLGFPAMMKLHMIREDVRAGRLQLDWRKFAFEKTTASMSAHLASVSQNCGQQQRRHFVIYDPVILQSRGI